jgi:hypothetical protein
MTAGQRSVLIPVSSVEFWTLAALGQRHMLSPRTGLYRMVGLRKKKGLPRESLAHSKAEMSDLLDPMQVNVTTMTTSETTYLTTAQHSMIWEKY